MNAENPVRSLCSRTIWVLLIASCLGLLSGQPARAANVGIVPVPLGRWDASSSLHPVGVLGDQTNFVGQKDPKNGDTFQWYSVDVQGGYLFAATGQGLEIFNINSTAVPTAPDSYIYGWITGSAFPYWQYSDKDWYVKSLDVPSDNNNVAVLGMEEQGFAIVVATTDANGAKAHPKVAYQAVIDTSAVYALPGGSAYALDRASGKVYRYSTTAAMGMTKCSETPPVTACPGVYQGILTTMGSGIVSISGTGNFVVTGKQGSTAGTMKIWNVSDPGAPAPVADIPGSSPAVTMWQQGSSYYAARLDSTGKILSVYNVSCVTGGCGSLSPISVVQLTAPQPLTHVTASTDNGRAYVYVGGEDLGTCAAQREYLFDMSNPAVPNELTPKIHPDGYWGWYYMSCSTGFNLVGPRVGVVYNNNFYRAANSVLDVHGLSVAQPPTAAFSWSPAEVYPGTVVTFHDESISNPAPISWSWSFAGGSPATGSGSAPTTTYSTVGGQSVSLTVQNSSGISNPATKTITVLDPTPQIGALAMSPSSPVQCQPITFTASGVAGQPQLGYAWEVDNVDSVPVPGTQGTATSLVWNTAGSGNSPAGQPGSYTAKLSVSNGAGSVTKTLPFTLGALGSLPEAFTPTNDPFTSGSVNFHAGATGATEWAWDFGSGTFGAWTNDPVQGPNPTHSYTSIGTYQVRVKVRNCLSPTEVVSLSLPVTITQITPLKAVFAANALCSSGLCFVNTNQPVSFLDQSTGAEIWNFDWNGDGDYLDAGEGDLTAADFPASGPRLITHTYTAEGQFIPKLRVRRGASEQDVVTLSNTIVVSAGGGGGGGGGASITISGVSAGQTGQAISLSASASGCTPAASGWTWSATDGTLGGTTTSSAVTVTYATSGSKTVTVTNSACSGATGTKTLAITSGGGGGGGGGGTLGANFTFSPGSPVPGQTVTFDGSSSTGSPQGYVWDFGDNSAFGSGVQATHTYAAPGNYRVSLSVNKPGNCPPAPFCENTLAKVIVIGNGEPPLTPAFTVTNATCTSEFGLVLCQAKAGDTVTFIDQSTGGPTGWSWDFGDGGKATGSTVTHVFTKTDQTFPVTLTITRGSANGTLQKSFKITGVVKAATSSVVLPWIAQSRGVLVQSSDLYVHNPGTAAIDVTLEFRKRGTPEDNPPKVTKTIQPGATEYLPDVLRNTFSRENIAGFVTVTVSKGDAQPLITSFNTTFQADGSQFGQTVPGVLMGNSNGAADSVGSRMQNLVGLNDNTDRTAYFGISNPNDQPATYRVTFYDKQGNAIGTPSADLVVSRFGQRQFQLSEVRSLFGITDQDDYRIQIETKSGGQLFPYGANLRTASEDPSFVGVGSPSTSKVYLVGALSTPGLNSSTWQSDVVLSNTGTQVVLTDLTFTRAGLTSQPTTPIHLTLQPGETRRLGDVVGTQWGVRDAVGVLTLDSDSPNSVFPIVQGESYDNSHPAMRFGQSMAALTDQDAATAGHSHYLVGLRQDSNYRTTYWLFNPGTETGEYDVIYRALDGHELGRVNGVRLGAGKMRQFSPGQHPIPAAGVEGGFTVQVVVKSGSMLSAAQVVNNRTNDPAYIQGGAY